MSLDAPVSTIMTAGPETVGPLTPLSTVREILFRLHTHHVPVVVGRKVVGIVSSNDLLRAGPAGRFPAAGRVDAVLEGTPARDVMTGDPVVLATTDPIHRAAELLRTGSFGSLPVVDEGELVGIVTVSDVLGYVLEREREREVPAEAPEQPPARRAGAAAKPTDTLVRQVLGELSDVEVARIIALGASEAELLEARAWLERDAETIGRLEGPSTGVVEEIVAIAQAAAEAEDEDDLR